MTLLTKSSKSNVSDASFPTCVLWNIEKLYKSGIALHHDRVFPKTLNSHLELTCFMFVSTLKLASMRLMLTSYLTMTSGLDGQFVYLYSCQGDIDGHMSIYTEMWRNRQASVYLFGKIGA